MPSIGYLHLALRGVSGCGGTDGEDLFGQY
jgi:hypothetical protein